MQHASYSTLKPIRRAILCYRRRPKFTASSTIPNRGRCRCKTATSRNTRVQSHVYPMLTSRGGGAHPWHPPASQSNALRGRVAALADWAQATSPHGKQNARAQHRRIFAASVLKKSYNEDSSARKHIYISTNILFVLSHQRATSEWSQYDN